MQICQKMEKSSPLLVINSQLVDMYSLWWLVMGKQYQNIVLSITLVLNAASDYDAKMAIILKVQDHPQYPNIIKHLVDVQYWCRDMSEPSLNVVTCLNHPWVTITMCQWHPQPYKLGPDLAKIRPIHPSRNGVPRVVQNHPQYLNGIKHLLYV